MKDHVFLMEALTDLDDDLITQAKSIRPRRSWTAWVAAAAAVAIMVGSSLFLPRISAGGSPPLIPSTDTYVNTMINFPALPYEQGYQGKPYNEKDASRITGMIVGPHRMDMTVRAIEILPDTYQTIGHGNPNYRLVRMELIRGLNTQYDGRYFYYATSAADPADLTKYDALVIESVAQSGHTGHVIYNVTQECLTVVDLPVLYGINPIFAFTDGVFDPSFRNSQESMQKRIEGSQYTHYPLSDTPSLSEYEQYITRGNVGVFTETIYTGIPANNQEIMDALEYVRPFENGIFVPYIDVYASLYYNKSVLYRRYAAGYPTNETVLITPEGATYSSIQFNHENLKELPDLASALEKVNRDFDVGLITPGHIENWQDMKYISHSIFGWYHKTGNGVYGVVRVSWSFHHYPEGGGLDVCRDDQYYLVKLGSDILTPIERDELAAMGGVDDRFMPGKYGYSKFGRNWPPYFAMY